MKITVEQVRQIIREELLRESGSFGVGDRVELSRDRVSGWDANQESPNYGSEVPVDPASGPFEVMDVGDRVGPESVPGELVSVLDAAGTNIYLNPADIHKV